MFDLFSPSNNSWSDLISGLVEDYLWLHLLHINDLILKWSLPFAQPWPTSVWPTYTHTPHTHTHTHTHTHIHTRPTSVWPWHCVLQIWAAEQARPAAPPVPRHRCVGTQTSKGWLAVTRLQGRVSVSADTPSPTVSVSVCNSVCIVSNIIIVVVIIFVVVVGIVIIIIVVVVAIAVVVIVIVIFINLFVYSSIFIKKVCDWF